MVAKNKSKKIDTTPVHVKNTKTGAKTKNDQSATLRWYHVLATIVVISMAIAAVVKIFSRFDISLYSSKHTIKYSSLFCTTSISGRVPSEDIDDYRYSGVKNGDYIGDKGITDKEEEAFVHIVKLGDKRIELEIRDYLSREWHTEKVNYGEEKRLITESVPDCMPGFAFSISEN